ncbi:MAG: TraB/GumN family protein, partial [Telluria sp.]
ALARHAAFAPGSPGIAGLAPERRARIETALARRGIPAADIARLKPWMLVTVLAVDDAVKLGYYPAHGVDSHLARLARENTSRKTRIAELETMEYQAALLNRLPDEAQWRLLEETLEHMDSGRQQRETRELFEAYDRADQAALEAIAARMDSDDSLSGKYLRELLLDERNGPMADKIAALLAREHNAVVAVGLLHLVGKRGVPELLRRRGIKVERVY